MDRYITSTELKQNLKRAKEYARAGLVHVLDNGRAGYVMCSVEVFESLVATTRRHAAWQAEAREVLREMEYDKLGGRVIALSEVVPIAGQVGLEAQVTHTAARDLALEYDGSARGELTHMLGRVVEDPKFGISVELEDVAYDVYKVAVPPCDVLYVYDEEASVVLVAGLVSENVKKG